MKSYSEIEEFLEIFQLLSDHEQVRLHREVEIEMIMQSILENKRQQWFATWEEQRKRDDEKHKQTVLKWMIVGIAVSAIVSALCTYFAVTLKG